MSSSANKLSKFQYNSDKSTGAKRKQPSRSSTSDPGDSPDFNIKKKQEKKKQKQMDPEEEENTAPVTLEEFQVEVGKLSTKEDIQTITEEFRKINEHLMKRLDMLESKIFEMEEERDKTNSEIKKLKEENVSLRGQMEQRKKELNGLRMAHNDQEQHGRSWNVRVFSVQEERGGEETAEACLRKSIKVFSQRVGVPVTEQDVEVAHRSGRPDGTRPRPILVRFFSRRVKGQVLADRRKLKNSGISISEDHTKTNYSLLTRANRHSATLATWSANGKVFGKLKNGKTLQLGIDTNLEEILSKAMA